VRSAVKSKRRFSRRDLKIGETFMEFRVELRPGNLVLAGTKLRTISRKKKPRQTEVWRGYIHKDVYQGGFTSYLLCCIAASAIKLISHNCYYTKFDAIRCMITSVSRILTDFLLVASGWTSYSDTPGLQRAALRNTL
jgi:hypothetical protein